MIDLAIIGAGPYGLSIAAHLKGRGCEFRIFGHPMEMWREHMPKGMRLKSEGFASGLYDPDSAFTLQTYCEHERIPYSDCGLPVPLDVFSSYGMAFQREFVPNLEAKRVISVTRCPGGFELQVGDGEVVRARRIVVAAGLRYFDYLPPVLCGLGEQWVTHSSRYGALDSFRGREVAVVGAGASALDFAALLHQAGAQVHLVARKSSIHFHAAPSGKPRTLLHRIRYPRTGLGVGSWRYFVFTKAPLVFRRMPKRFRIRTVQAQLSPRPGWFVKDEVVGKVPFHLGVTISEAAVRDGRIHMQLVDRAGVTQTLSADHVIAATGYKADVKRIAFLSPELSATIRCVEGAPALSANFESSASGLYFVGAAAAYTFGPLMCFAFGAQYAASRLSKHLAGLASKNKAGAVYERSHEAVAGL